MEFNENIRSRYRPCLEITRDFGLNNFNLRSCETVADSYAHDLSKIAIKMTKRSSLYFMLYPLPLEVSGFATGLKLYGGNL